MDKSAGLSSFYLWNLCSKLLPNFSGVVSCDRIHLAFPNLDHTQLAIVNSLERHFVHGGHWLAVGYDSKKEKFHFWDPLGFNVSSYPMIEEFLRSQRKPILDYNKEIQHGLSVHCGYHALAFLLSLQLELDVKAFFDLYNVENLLVNDDISKEFIMAYIGKQSDSQSTTGDGVTS